MLKNIVVLEVKKGERIYQLQLSSESPLGEVFDALNEMRLFVYDKIKEGVEEAKKQDSEKVSELPKEEV